MIDLYLRPIDFSNHLEEQLSKLPLFIQERILKKKQAKKRLSSLAGYTLLQEILQNENCSLDDIVFLNSGKPILKENKLHFNISHCDSLLGVAICKTDPIGLDIEKFRTFAKADAAFAFFSPMEQQSISSAENPSKKTIEFWSKKEALIKLLGNQMFDISAATDVRFSSTNWLNKKYFFYPISYDFDGYIHIASLLPTENIVLK